jgi:hypothetical protein
MKTITYRLFAGDGKQGTISIPRDLTEDQIERVWAQLDAIKVLALAYAAVRTVRNETLLADT